MPDPNKTVLRFSCVSRIPLVVLPNERDVCDRTLAFHTDLGLSGIFFAAAAVMVIYGVIISGALKLGSWRQP